MGAGRKKRFFAVCMMLVLIVGLVSTDRYQVYAKENDGTNLLLNPLYEEILDVDAEATELAELENGGIMLLDTGIVCETEKAASDYLKSQMVQRKNTIICLLDPKEYRAESFQHIFQMAIAHSEDGRGQEGDSLAFGWKSRKGRITETSEYVQLTYYLTYYTDVEQEKELTIEVNQAMEEMELAYKTDYEKIKTIYQYVCDNVDYDSYSTDYLKYTPYAALCHGTAVCQGYAVLFYRFCTEADISARVIGGIGNDVLHAWNIVELNDKYYNLDSTWDGEYETTTYHWFLKNEADFLGHTREEAYQTPEFHAAYPMAEVSYTENQNMDSDYTGLKNDNGVWKYYENGVWNVEKYGFVTFKENKFLVAGGKVATEKNGLAQDPDDTNDWYFLANGQVQTQHTGLAEYDGAWFYIDKGRLDTKLSAYVSYDEGLFYVGAGRILREVNGLAQDPDCTNDWYFLSNGQAQIQYTGLTQYDGAWFYVENGVLAKDYTGYVEYDGSQFYVKNGMLQ